MASQIKSFSFSRLTNGAKVEFLTHVQEKITTVTPEKLKIEALAPVFESALAKFQEIVNRLTAYKSTFNLKGGDQQRDLLVNVLFNVADAHSRNPIEAFRLAAELLLALFAAFRGITRHEYSKETAEIRGLLKKLEGEEYVAALAQLGLTEVREELEAVNQKFHEDMAAKAAEETERLQLTGTDSVVLAEAAYESYKAIVQLVNAYALVSPTEDITKFIDDVNGFVNIYSRVSGNSGKGGDDGDGSDRPVIPDDDETDEPGDEDDRPVIPDEGDGDDDSTTTGDGTQPGKDENGDDLPPIE